MAQKEKTSERLEGAPRLEELQRGQEEPPTVELMERSARAAHPPAGETQVPDPGERPGAIRPESSAPPDNSAP